MSVPDTVRHASAQVVFEEYPIVGFNYRMTDIQAAIGREQLKRLPAIVGAGAQLADALPRAAAAACRGVILPTEPEWARTNWQSYCVRLEAGLDQRTVMQRMLDDGVATRRGAHERTPGAGVPAGHVALRGRL